MMTKVFYPVLGEKIKVYIDDILVKSCERHQHDTDLEIAFRLLRHFEIKLNLAKCAFGVSAEKSMDFWFKKKMNRATSYVDSCHTGLVISSKQERSSASHRETSRSMTLYHLFNRYSTAIF